MKQGLKILLVLCAVGLIRQDFGPLSFDLGRLLAILLLTAYVLSLLPVSRGRIYLVPCAVFGCLLALRQESTPLQLAGVCLLLSAAALYAQWRRCLQAPADFGILTAAACACLAFLYEYNTACWYAVEYGSRIFSAVCTFIYRRQLNIGPTAFGFFIIASFAVYHSIIFLLDRKRSILKMAAAQVYLTVAAVAFVGLNLLAASIISRYGFAINRSDLHTQAILFLLLSVSLLLQRSQQLTGSAILPAKRALPAVCVCCIALGAMLFMILGQAVPERMPKEKKVAFYVKGSLDWDVPRFGTYGQRSGGMFGLMPQYLSSVGFRTGMLDSLTPAALADADLLVMINLDRALERQELFTVWNFVRHGGGLLLLGDHTNLGGLMQHFNEILMHVPLRFQFDSAMPSRYTWDYLMDVRPHVLTAGLAPQVAGSWWVGATLQCLPPAIPLVVGRYCYADQGYAHNVSQAYLGNRRFDYYERQNDVVLAACVRYGDGLIVACGDTSAFHNTTFMTTSTLVVNVCNVLADRADMPNRRLRTALVLGIAGCCVVLLVLTVVPSMNLAVPIALVLSLAAAAWYSGYRQMAAQVRSIPADKLNVAYIDYAHAGRFDQMSWEDDSIGGLKNNLLRNGFFPMPLERWDRTAIMQVKALILIAPTRKFSDDEVTILKDFATRGGRLLLSVGWEEQDASRAVLRAFGLGLDSVPLAQATCEYPGREKTIVQFHEAWPVVYTSEENINVLCKPLGYPVVVSRAVGRGSVTVIGDSSFLLNENLEGSKNYSLSNMLLLRDLLTK